MKAILIRLTTDMRAGDHLLVEADGTVHPVDVAQANGTSVTRLSPRYADKHLQEVLALFEAGRTRSTRQVATTLRLNPKTASGYLARLTRAGELVRLQRGHYCTPLTAAAEAAAAIAH